MLVHVRRHQVLHVRQRLLHVALRVVEVVDRLHSAQIVALVFLVKPFGCAHAQLVLLVVRVGDRLDFHLPRKISLAARMQTLHIINIDGFVHLVTVC